MEHWARSLPTVQFLCVCVDALGVALQFERMFQFQSVVNAHIPSRGYMPVGYGQLGCSGFIVVDTKGNFISRKTKPYLQYDVAAFHHVEQLLENYLGEELRSAPAEKKKKPSLDTVVPAPPSVGIDSMDQEHERCADALTQLLRTPSETTLLQALQELQSHFDHEEALMKEHGFGGGDDGSSFSALHSHVSDHNKILNMARKELQRIASFQNNAPAAGCGEGTANGV
jgi:hypothetical protein